MRPARTAHVLALMAATAAVAVPAAAPAVGATPLAKPRPRPAPTRAAKHLWYRVSVVFAGKRTTTYPSGAVDEQRAAWSLESRTAIVLDHMCSNLPFPGNAVYVGQLRDRHRRDRACQPGQKETVAFTAGADLTGSFSSKQTTPARGCAEQSIVDTWEWSGTVPGSIGTNGVDGALLFGPEAAQVEVPAVYGPCHSVDDGSEMRKAETRQELRALTSQPGFDGDTPPTYIPVSHRLAATVGPLTYGQAFNRRATFDRTIVETNDDGGEAYRVAYDYEWTAHFEPCPDFGRDVETC